VKIPACKMDFDDPNILILANAFFALLKAGIKHIQKQNKISFYLKIFENLLILGVKQPFF
jgi:hypothetical protein